MLKLENKRYSDETLSLAKQVTATGFNMLKSFGLPTYFEPLRKRRKRCTIKSENLIGNMTA